MERRKFILGVGSLAAGGAAAMGTGAFATEARDRAAVGTISNDDTAYLSLKPGDYSSLASDGALEINLEYLNADATTQLDNVFIIENSGSGPVEIGIDDIESVSGVTVDAAPVAGGSGELINGPFPTIGVGNQITVGVTVTTEDIPAGQTNTLQFDVNADSA